jgi:hypothetical protein
MQKTKPITTAINAALKRAKLDNRFVRGQGYYYVTGGVRAGGLYQYRLNNDDPRDWIAAVEYVQDVLMEEGTPVDLSALLKDKKW